METNPSSQNMVRREFLKTSLGFAAAAAATPDLFTSGQFYTNTTLKNTRALDHGDLDIVATVLPAAKKRGLKLFCGIEDVFRSDVPGVKDVTEVDLQGSRTAASLCLFHPNMRAFWTGLRESIK